MAALLVIADDLTGATDAGAQFAALGMPTRIVPLPQCFDRATAEPGRVCVVNSESRHLPAKDAADVVRRLAETGVQGGFTHFYKKTDSTLRGNIGAELEALLRATGARYLPFVPASPGLGRTTEGGVHYVHGTPLHLTSYASDPLNPIRTSDVRDLLSAQARCPVTLFGSAESEFARFRSHPSTLGGIAVFDCATLSDYARIGALLNETESFSVGAAARRPGDRRHAAIAAGPAAFAREIAAGWGFVGLTAPPTPLESPLLIVNGSLNPVSLEQVDLIAAPRIVISPTALFSREAKLQSWADSSGVVVMQTVREAGEEAQYLHAAAGLGFSKEQAHHFAAARLGEITSRLINAGAFRSVLVIGGDTLAGLARAARWKSLVAEGELVPGIASAVEPQSGLKVLTKPGGFGNQRALIELLALLTTVRN